MARAALYGASLLYRMVVFFRNSLYDGYQYWSTHRYFPGYIHPSNRRIISIGNIVAGGTGKTPLTILIASYILDRKKKLAILSRGYKSRFHKSGYPVIVSKGNGPECSAQQCGDEPYLISKNTKGAYFIVSKDRIAGVKLAVENNAQIILLDDGMQHRRLLKDYEIVLLDANDPFGKKYFLPRGFLRDHPKSLKRADLIVVNHAQSEQQIKELEKVLRKWSSAPVVGASSVYMGTFSLDNKISYDLTNKKVVVFCGIAKPHYFVDLLEKQGAHIVSFHRLLDHESPSSEFLEKIFQEAQYQKVDYIVCTEKDAVKIKQQSRPLVTIAYVKMKLKIEFGKEIFEKALLEMI